MIPEAIKKKINRFDYIKIRNFYLAKVTTMLKEQNDKYLQLT